MLKRRSFIRHPGGSLVDVPSSLPAEESDDSHSYTSAFPTVTRSMPDILVWAPDDEKKEHAQPICAFDAQRASEELALELAQEGIDHHARGFDGRAVSGQSFDEVADIFFSGPERSTSMDDADYIRTSEENAWVGMMMQNQPPRPTPTTKTKPNKNRAFTFVLQSLRILPKTQKQKTKVSQQQDVPLDVHVQTALHGEDSRRTIDTATLGRRQTLSTRKRATPIAERVSMDAPCSPSANKEPQSHPLSKLSRLNRSMSSLFSNTPQSRSKPPPVPPMPTMHHNHSHPETIPRRSFTLRRRKSQLPPATAGAVTSPDGPLNRLPLKRETADSRSLSSDSPDDSPSSPQTSDSSEPETPYDTDACADISFLPSKSLTSLHGDV
ncbi:hypothetical protein SISNIDRAFT_448201 [Sistotremastrum niveocremeum HHB9708]|uniref:Uncharacterized protein n=2 Tax=Sistotremastraceae TaxID=3402574 RepID=A0A165AMW3_9AGAM|nr:hypothetical protein SISNIDRAFT_448201 [Sistotremastrum niveocremeum HHB9708]KZT36970.1 hypothetical protein SISSUDRAFT_1049097 [Sistotremastrum suecicum HHB10207 ss-3]